MFPWAMFTLASGLCWMPGISELFHLGLGFFCGMQPLNCSLWEPTQRKMELSEFWIRSWGILGLLVFWSKDSASQTPGLFLQDESSSDFHFSLYLVFPHFKERKLLLQLQDTKDLKIYKSVNILILH